MDFNLWDFQGDTESFSSEDSDNIYFDEPDYMDNFAAIFRDGSRRPLRTRDLRLSGLISLTPDLHTPGYDVMAGTSSRSSLDDTVMDIDPPEDPDGKGETKQIRKLLDLCSRVVARSYTCEQLENSQPPLDESMLKGIAQWAFPMDEKQVRAYSNLTDKYNYWDRGLNLFKENRIKEMWQVGFMAAAHLSKYSMTAPATSKPSSPDDNCEIRISLTFEQQRIISSTCSDCRAEIWCPHVLAAIIYRIRKSAQVSVHAPMTEALSTLSRDQLQKLLQYAVQEDPAGILGRVFKHLDDIRDTMSDMNTTAGAPDPTFGRAQGCKTQWQLSVEVMEKNLKSDLNELVRESSYSRSSPGFYPNNFDLMEKKESKMFKYMKKVIDLARKKEVKAASNVLTRISNCLLQKMEGITESDDCPSLNRFGHDLARFYTLFMFTTKPYMQAFLYKSAIEMQIRSAAVMNFQINNSDFAELPSIAPHLKGKLDQHLRTGLFTEALCAYETGLPTQELKDLLDGKISPEDSLYEEDLPIMLARLEAVNWLEIGSVSSKMAHLATRIIYKVLGIIQKDSIIGAYLENFGQSTPEALAIINILKTGESCPSPPPAPTKGKGRGKKGKSTKKQKKSHSTSDNAELHPQLSKNQLTYTLLYLCHCMIQWQRKSPKKTNYERQLIGFCMLALEMSRHRTSIPRNQITNAESNWLLRMEMSVSDFLESNVNNATEAVNLYLDAFTAVGVCFYQGVYPLVLIDILLCPLFVKNEKMKPRVDDVVALCAAFVQDSHNPLEKFTLPSSTPFDSILDNPNWPPFWKLSGGLGQTKVQYSVFTASQQQNDHRRTVRLPWDPAEIRLDQRIEALNQRMLEFYVAGCDEPPDPDKLPEALTNDRLNRFERCHKDFAQKKFHTIIETFLSQIDTSKKAHINLAQKVFQQFETYDSYTLLRRITKDLRFHIAKLDDQPELLEGALKVLLHTLQRSETVYLMVRGAHRREDIDFIFSLVRKLGIPSLRLFISRWHKFFECRNLKELLLVLKPQITEPKAIPKEVTLLVMQYYEADVVHEDGACSLLSFFKANDTNFKKATKIILANAKNFTVNSLFELAKLELANNGKKNKAGEELMNEDVFAIVEKTLSNLKLTSPSSISPDTYGHLEWLCAKCTLGTVKDVTAKNSFLTRTILHLKENCGTHPGVLLHMLQKLEQIPGFAKTANSLGDAMITAYTQHFVERFHECSHSAYGNVINEMRCAQLHCKQYVKTGDVLFESRVVSKVRGVHSGKKKLLRMLDGEFRQKAVSGAAAAISSKSK